MHISRWIVTTLAAAAFVVAPSAEAQSRLTGAKIGSIVTPNAARMDVVVKRELSPEDGFPADAGGRWQAHGTARGLLATNAAILKDARGRWHTVETNVPIANSTFTSSRADVRAAVGVQGCSAERYEVLKRRANDAKGPAAEAAFLQLMSEAFGLDSTSVAVVRSEADAQPTKLSFMLQFTKAEAITVTSKTPRRELLAAGERDDPKKRRAPPAIVFGPGAFRGDLHRAAGILAHEGTHASHMTRADVLLEEWRATGRRASFIGWLDNKRTHGDISLEDVDTTSEQASGGSAQTEVLASANELAAAFPAMRIDDPATPKPLLDIDAYRSIGDAQQKRLNARLEAVYVTLDAPHKRLFDETVAGKKNSGNVLGRFVHPR